MSKYISTSTKGLGYRLNKLGYSSYKEYLSSIHWRFFRKKFYSQSKRVKRMLAKRGFVWCEWCKSRDRLCLHHKTYKHLGSEFLDDVVLICQNCHDEVHKLESFGFNLWKATKIIKQRKLRNKSKHLCK